MRREVAAELEIEITAPTTLEFQIAVAPHPNTEGQLHVGVGNLTVDYAASIVDGPTRRR